MVILSEYNKSVTGYDDDYKKARFYLAKYWNELDMMKCFSNDADDYIPTTNQMYLLAGFLIFIMFQRVLIKESKLY